MRFILSIFFIFLTPLYLFSQTVDIKDENIKKLSKHPTWLKLLHYDKKQKKSTIISDDFFISSKGKNDPQSELIATIDAYFETSLTDQSVRCKFPARYFWLSKHMKLPDYKIVDEKCKKLAKWSILKDIKSVSLIYVSGYLGNPASTFGHSFLKLNRDSEKGDNNLFDSSVSYGALVPDNEFAPLYIYKGITGGYEAGFTDKYYYTQDLAYSNTEFRDIWDYKLNLAKEKQKLLLLHIWEVIGHKFQYFFASKNCAYEVSKLLELVVDEPIVHSADYWYAPVEGCHSFRDIDIQRSKSQKSLLIDKITYIPSEQRVIYAHYNSLSKQEKEIVSFMIEQKKEVIPSQHNRLSSDKKIEIVDFVLAYYKYLLVKKPDANETIALKNKILLQRLMLPIKEKKKFLVKDRTSPDLDNKPISFSTALSYSSRQKQYPSISFSPFTAASTGQNTLEGNELIVLDATVGFNGKKDDLFLEKFDFIKIRNFKTMQMPFDVESPWSWKMHVGVEHQSDYDFFVDTGIGKAWRVNDVFLIYSMLNASAHTVESHFRVSPDVGMHIDLNRLKIIFSTGFESDLNFENQHSVSLIEGDYMIYKNTALSFQYKKNIIEKASIGLQWFF